MQSGVLWEEPELAVDWIVKGHGAVGTEILLTQPVQLRSSFQPEISAGV